MVEVDPLLEKQFPGITRMKNELKVLLYSIAIYKSEKCLTADKCTLVFVDRTGNGIMGRHPNSQLQWSSCLVLE